MLDPKGLPNGAEQYERFTPQHRRNAAPRIQYDYRHTDGTLFSCVKTTLEECRAARDAWVKARQ